MTAGEVIALLSKVPPDTKVYIVERDDYGESLESVSEVEDVNSGVIIR